MEIIPYGKQTISFRDLLSVSKSLFSPFLTQGPSVTKFEEEISQLVGVNHCVATNSATSALIAAYQALGLGKGTLVWTTPISFVATSNAALHNGCNIDFVDIDPLTGLISLDSLHSKLVEAKKQDKLPNCICIVHLYGLSVDMRQIKKLSDEYGFTIIEDASHALSSVYNNNYIGSCLQSDACIFSFHPVKNITTGEGGCITTNRREVYLKLRSLVSHGITKDHSKYIQKYHMPWSYEQQQLGYNFRMTDLQASLGVSQLKRLNSFKLKRSSIMNFYYDKFQDLPLKLIYDKTKNDPFYHLAVIVLESSEYQLLLYNYLRKMNIFSQVHYTPIHLQPYYRGLGFAEGGFPYSEAFSRRILSLPLFPTLSKSKVKYVAKCVNTFFDEIRG